MVDREELGRRLRAMFIALNRHGTAQETVARYEQVRDEVFEAQSVDEGIEGSWGWWANKVLENIE